MGGGGAVGRVGWGGGSRWGDLSAIIIHTATVLVFERICYGQSR